MSYIVDQGLNIINNQTTVTATYSIGPSDGYLICNVSTGVTYSVTLPDATVDPKKEYVIINIGSVGVNVLTTSSQLINGTSSARTVTATTGIHKYVSNGTGWVIAQ